MKPLEQLIDISAQITKDLSTMLFIGNMKDSRAVSVFIARKYAQLLTELADEACQRKIRNRKKKRRKDNDCIVVAGIKWTKSNLKVGDKEHFTFDEAQKLCPKGWRIPTNEEQQKLRDECSFYFDADRKEGVFTDKKTGAELRLPADGARPSSSGELCSQGVSGHYWASTQYETERGYGMYFDSISVYPSGNANKSRGLSVRCVRD